MAEGNAISVKIGAETDGIEQGLRSIQQSLGRLENSSKQSGDMFDASFKKIAGATAVGQLAVDAFGKAVDLAFSGARQVVDGFSDALDLGGRLNDLQARTGETAGSLLVLEQAFTNSGLEADKVGTAISKLQNFMADAAAGGDAQTATMQRLGISLAELEGKTPTDQMGIFAQRIAAIEDPTLRAAAASDVFGEKLGPKLLPLLASFTGELENATLEVGSLKGIMDEQADTFDKVDDGLSVLNNKFRDFAAGILAETIPAVEAVIDALKKFDAAQLGQDLAAAFKGGNAAMQGFQAAVDAFSIGEIQQGFEILWESITLQASQTANEIYKRLVASFKTAGDFVADIFDPNGTIVTYIIGAFELVGLKIEEALMGATLRYIDAFPDLFVQLNPVLAAFRAEIEKNVNRATEDARVIWGAMANDVVHVKDQVVGAAGAVEKNFNTNLANTGNLFTGLDEKAAAFRDKIGETSEKAAAFTANLGDGRRETEALIEAQKRSYDQETAKAEAAAQTSVEAQKAVQLEIDLNNAKAAGNEELVNELESRKQAVANQEKINNLTEEFKRLMPEEVARQMAQELVKSQNAAAGLSNNTLNAAGGMGNVRKSSADSLTYIQGVRDELVAMGKIPPPEPIVAMAGSMKDVKSELEAADQILGTKFANMSLPDIVDELNIPGIFPDTESQIAAIMPAIKQAVSEVKANVVDEAKSKESTDNVAANAKSTLGAAAQNPINESAGIDSITALTGKLNSIGQSTIEVPLDADSSLAEISTKIKNFEDTPVVLSFDLSDLDRQLATIRADLQNNFIGGQGGPGGQGGFGGQGGSGGEGGSFDASNFQSVITAIQEVRDRLPLIALAA